MVIIPYTLQVFIPLFVNALSIVFKEKYAFQNDTGLTQTKTIDSS